MTWQWSEKEKDGAEIGLIGRDVKETGRWFLGLWLEQVDEWWLSSETVRRERETVSVFWTLMCSLSII